MSKYTTEVRYICETYAGLTESVGYADIEKTIQAAIPKIFDFEFPIFDESYRNVLETKILRHYYTREIGLETVALWKFKLCTRMNEIMPYYNKLYKSELIDFNPLYDVELTTQNDTTSNQNNEKTSTSNRESGNTTHTETSRDVNVSDERSSSRDIDRNDDTSQTAEGQNSTNIGTTSTENKQNMYSDTPQGAITDLQSGKYLTNATLDTGTTTGTSSTTATDNNTVTTNSSSSSTDDFSEDYTSDTKDSSSSDTTFNSTGRDTSSENNEITTTSNYITKVIGTNGGKTFTEKIVDLRNSLINIDMMIIDELEDLFFQLW